MELVHSLLAFAIFLMCRLAFAQRSSRPSLMPGEPGRSMTISFESGIFPVTTTKAAIGPTVVVTIVATDVSPASTEFLQVTPTIFVQPETFTGTLQSASSTQFVTPSDNVQESIAFVQTSTHVVQPSVPPDVVPLSASSQRSASLGAIQSSASPSMTQSSMSPQPSSTPSMTQSSMSSQPSASPGVTQSSVSSQPSVSPGVIQTSAFPSMTQSSMSSQPSASPGVIQTSASPIMTQLSMSSQPSASPDVIQPSSPSMRQSSASPGVTQPSASPSMLQSSASPSVTQPSASPGVTQPSVSPGVIQPSASPHVTQPSVSSGVIQPSAPPSVTQPSASPGMTQPSVSPGVTQPSVSPVMIQSSAFPGAQPSASIGVTQSSVSSPPLVSSGVIQPSAPPGSTQPLSSSAALPTSSSQPQQTPSTAEASPTLSPAPERHSAMFELQLIDPVPSQDTAVVTAGLASLLEVSEADIFNVILALVNTKRRQAQSLFNVVRFSVWASSTESLMVVQQTVQGLQERIVTGDQVTLMVGNLTVQVAYIQVLGATPQPPVGEGLSTGVITGIIIGSLFVALVVLICILAIGYYFRKRAHSKTYQFETLHPTRASGGEEYTTPPQTLIALHPTRFSGGEEYTTSSFSRKDGDQV